MKYIFIIPLLALSLTGCCQNKQTEKTAMKKTTAASTCSEGCSDNCGDSERSLSCKLTSPEMQKRKATVIASLKKQIIEKKELDNGYTYKFKGTDQVVDEMTEFIKTERQCCDFFDFNIKVAGDGTATWLSITGPKGAKDFIKSELEL